MIVKTNWLPYDPVSGEITRLSYIDMNRIISNFIEISKKFTYYNMKMFLRNIGNIRTQKDFAFIDYILFIELNLKEMLIHFLEEDEIEYRDDYKKYGDILTFNDINRIEGNMKLLDGILERQSGNIVNKILNTFSLGNSNNLLPISFVKSKKYEDVELEFYDRPKTKNDAIKLTKKYMIFTFGTEQAETYNYVFIYESEDDFIIEARRKNSSFYYTIIINKVKITIIRESPL